MKNMLKKSMLMLVVLSIVLSLFAGAALADVVAQDGTTYIRSTPSLSGKDLGTLPKGASATYLGDTKRDDRGVAWYYISYKGTTGWVSSMYTHLNSDTSYNDKHGSLWATGNVRMRSLPSLSGSIICTISNGERVNYLDKTSVDDRGVTWYYVSWDTKTGWVSSQYLSKSYKGSSGSGSSGSSSSYKKVVGSSGKSNIRTIPSLGGKILGTLPQGESAKYLGETRYDDRGIAWYKISYNGITGWVSSKYTKLK